MQFVNKTTISKYLSKNSKKDVHQVLTSK